MESRREPQQSKQKEERSGTGVHRWSDPAFSTDVHRPSRPRIVSDPPPQKQSEASIESDRSQLGLHPTSLQRGRMQKKAEIKVDISFVGCDHWEGMAFLDTGADDNWISRRLCEKLCLPRQTHAEEYFKGFGGESVKSDTIVNGYWHYHLRSFDVTFRLAADPHFDVLFGFALLQQVGLVDFEQNDQTHAGHVWTLVKAGEPSKEDKQKDRAHAQNEVDRHAKAKVFKQLQDSGWKWDEAKRQFFTTDRDGKTHWCQEKW